MKERKFWPCITYSWFKSTTLLARNLCPISKAVRYFIVSIGGIVKNKLNLAHSLTRTITLYVIIVCFIELTIFYYAFNFEVTVNVSIWTLSTRRLI